MTEIRIGPRPKLPRESETRTTTKAAIASPRPIDHPSQLPAPRAAAASARVQPSGRQNASSAAELVALPGSSVDDETEPGRVEAETRLGPPRRRRTPR